MRSKGTEWATLSVNQQPASVPRAVLLHRDLDLQQLTWPSNKIIPAEQAWHFLCSGRDGMLPCCAEYNVFLRVSTLCE